ncbi:MAG: hypothetical protein SCALA702_00210 [Melioribacteraceae bacterium]|nr:MAG: hypothetical protein SCALA702_00210 [Melioribacteraceae bacterium]
MILKGNFVIAIFLMLLSGCSLNTETKKMQQDLDSLKNILISTDSLMKGLDNRISELEAKSLLSELLKDSEKGAILTIGESGYSSVVSDLGVLTVSLENVSKYASGTKLTLRFGNILSTTINGLQFEVFYAPKTENADYDYWNEKSKKVTLSKSLEKGSWTTTNVIIQDISPEEIKNIWIKNVYHTGITLQNR